MRRRQCLRTAATAATATATATATTTAAATATTTAVGTFLTGCLGDPATSTTDSTTATTTGTATAADDCPGVTRLSLRYDSVEQESLVLRSSADSVAVGEGRFGFVKPPRPQYRSCDPAESGQYRFVFWGIVGQTDGERETEAALTRRFRVTDS